jgi:protein-S-isoprenylcysteine O-methyltransferase Ste14
MPPSRLPALGPRGEGWVVGQLVLLWALVVAAYVGGQPVGEPAQSIARIAGLLAMLGGGAIIAVGALQLRRAMSVLPRPAADGTLVETGLYARVRHPIYDGVILMAAGVSLLSASVAAGLVTIALAAWFDLKSRREEAWLRDRYPDYADYAGRTRRFIPGVY